MSLTIHAPEGKMEATFHVEWVKKQIELAVLIIH